MSKSLFVYLYLTEEGVAVPGAEDVTVGVAVGVTAGVTVAVAVAVTVAVCGAGGSGELQADIGVPGLFDRAGPELAEQPVLGASPLAVTNTVDADH